MLSDPFSRIFHSTGMDIMIQAAFESVIYVELRCRFEKGDGVTFSLETLWLILVIFGQNSLNFFVSVLETLW